MSGCSSILRRMQSRPCWTRCGWTPCSSTVRWTCQRFAHRFRLPLWRPVGIASAADVPAVSGGADVLLLEAQPPPKATRPGGNARTFDWSLLRGWTAPAPWILAGGLTPENVADAIRTTAARAVDVSSGVEKARGIKDPALIRAFIANARAAYSLSRAAGEGWGGGEAKSTLPNTLSQPPPQRGRGELTRLPHS